MSEYDWADEGLGVSHDWVDEESKLLRGMQWMGGGFPPSRMIVSDIDLTGGTTTLFYEEKLRTSYVHLFGV